MIRTVRQGADFTEIWIKEGQYPLGIAFNLKLFDFPIFHLKRTWWRLFQWYVVHTKFDIYVCIVVISNLFHFWIAKSVFVFSLTAMDGCMQNTQHIIIKFDYHLVIL